MKGMVAAGHPLTAEAGARVLREGGNAVDAAIAAMLTSWVAEPLLTGPGAGGYMMVAGAGETETLLDFFVAALGGGGGEDHGDLTAMEVSLGDATHFSHVAPASVGAYGTPAGIEEAARRWGTVPLAELAAPAAAHARAGIETNEVQAYIGGILEGIVGERLLREGDVFQDDELAETIERPGADRAAP